MGKRNRNVLQEERSFFCESLHLVGQYFKSRLLVSLIFTVVCWLIMWLVLDLKGAIPVSIMIGLFNLVPYIGPIVAMIVTAIVVVFQDPMDVLWMTILQFGLQIIDTVLLSPLMLGKSMGLHPIVVFVAIFIGGSVFGVVGMIIATPVAAIAALAARRIRRYLREKNAPVISSGSGEQSGSGQDGGDTNAN
ncbi:MAG: AI-2E family transporter [Clostridia bacterium]|jgi:predicted PurR-regulated permease PerM|nr:AI-2E family transporter [Clostridia bacterium]MBT7122009.1 AI-2E family transporter [Clostridia bacterium]